MARGSLLQDDPPGRNLVQKDRLFRYLVRHVYTKSCIKSGVLSIPKRSELMKVGTETRIDVDDVA
jgi:hypothetical protein